ncbi:MAG: hypothetical protein OXH37_04165, partial [Gammaproteobacteria bacterium]|nr:hypothetical protein [Gammaproteobacteria bacterium]
MKLTVALSVVRTFSAFASVLALAAAPSALAQREYMIPLLLADGDPFREGFVRIINNSVVLPPRPADAKPRLPAPGPR